MKIEHSGCVNSVSFDTTPYAANLIIRTAMKYRKISCIESCLAYTAFYIGDEDEDLVEELGDVVLYPETTNENEILERTRFYLEDKDSIWILMPKTEVYLNER